MILEDMKKIELRTEIPGFLLRNNLNQRICEIGVRFGYNLQNLLTANPKLLVGIDHYRATKNPGQQDTGMSQEKLDEIYRDVFKRFLEFPAVRIFRGTSKEVHTLFPIHFFDFIYIDADHTEEGAWQDICLWWKRVRQGGILAGHDYIEANSQIGTEFGVIKAVNRFVEEKKISSKCFHFTKEGYRTWMIFKIEGE